MRKRKKIESYLGEGLPFWEKVNPSSPNKKFFAEKIEG